MRTVDDARYQVNACKRLIATATVWRGENQGECRAKIDQGSLFRVMQVSYLRPLRPFSANSAIKGLPTHEGGLRISNRRERRERGEQPQRRGENKTQNNQGVLTELPFRFQSPPPLLEPQSPQPIHAGMSNRRRGHAPPLAPGASVENSGNGRQQHVAPVELCRAFVEVR